MWLPWCMLWGQYCWAFYEGITSLKPWARNFMLSFTNYKYFKENVLLAISIFKVCTRGKEQFLIRLHLPNKKHLCLLTEDSLPQLPSVFQKSDLTVVHYSNGISHLDFITAICHTWTLKQHQYLCSTDGKNVSVFCDTCVMLCCSFYHRLISSDGENYTESFFLRNTGGRYWQ